MGSVPVFWRCFTNGSQWLVRTMRVAKQALSHLGAQRELHEHVNQLVSPTWDCGWPKPAAFVLEVVFCIWPVKQSLECGDRFSLQTWPCLQRHRSPG
mmetsp:Transcript_111954/g.222513  ORF Transcript_111954/g.222513 Transcript_111954/m.222513 type:complete len:97 (+) Transcript_111954:267-557(+)